MNQNYDPSDRSVQIVIPGDVLSTNVDSIRAAIFDAIESDEALQGGYERICLDLTAAKMIDSAGLNLLVSVLKVAKSRQASVIAKITSPHIQRTFSFTRLDKLIQVEKAETTTA
jgi:anti-anti-sigma factor